MNLWQRLEKLLKKKEKNTNECDLQFEIQKNICILSDFSEVLLEGQINTS